MSQLDSKNIKGKNMKYTLATLALVFSSAAVANSNDAIENVSAIGAAQKVCGFTVNNAMFEIAVSSLFAKPSDIEPGGKHWAQVKENLQRIQSLTETEEGRRSFCNRVSRDLSAFFD